MNYMRLGCLFLFLLSCSTLTSNDSGGARKEIKNLSEDYARYRSAGMSEIRYQLEFDLTGTHEFTGKSKIDFDLSEQKELTVDFLEGKVVSVIVNDTKVLQPTYNSIFIKIPRHLTKKGKNSVAIEFSHEYSATPKGLYRFVDPEDKRVYVYSNFEPNSANKMFPCFDQPDLKATYQTIVTTPKNWTVVSSNRENQIRSFDDRKVWHFPESMKFSTYVYSLHAGEYHVWRDKVPNKTPLRLFVRESMAKYVDIEEWFSTTRKGLQYFEEFFGYLYPFKKYDQLIVPHFPSGAMENVAAVTFNETYISRTKKEREEKISMASVILHEMAHMWFGNLVTMEWWNDLWLNESFATYLSYKALEKITPYKESWLIFLTGYKEWAYFQDQSVITHPILFDVPDTDVIFSSFDGITYGKGSSVLKQFDFFVGEKTFQKGLNNYFRKHAFGNTRLRDFIHAMELASGKDLRPWSKAWLESAQVNSIEVSYQCNEGKIENALLNQSAVKEYPVLRDHKTRIGVYEIKNGKFLLKKLIPFGYSGEKTPISELNGVQCGLGTIIYPNVDDFDYVKVVLDPITLESIALDLPNSGNEVLRASLWSDLWSMVRDQKMVALQFFNLAINHLDNEKRTEIIDSAASNIWKILSFYFPHTKEGKEMRESYRKRWVEFLFKKIQGSTEIDEQKKWFDFYVQNLENSEDLEKIVSYLDNKPKWLKFEIDQDRRWVLLKKLGQFAYKDYGKRIDDEAAHDKSERGENSYISAKTIVPNLQNKRDYWEQIIRPPSLEFPLSKMKTIMFSLFPASQEYIQREFIEDFYFQLKKLKGSVPDYLKSFVSLVPNFCSVESVQKMNNFLSENNDLIPAVSNYLKISAESNNRCVGIRGLVTKAIAEQNETASFEGRHSDQ